MLLLTLSIIKSGISHFLFLQISFTQFMPLVASFASLSD